MSRQSADHVHRPAHGGTHQIRRPRFSRTKITFINDIAELCEKVGADVQDVARGIGLGNRTGGKFLYAGPGFGGSCLPKDTIALIKTGQDAPRRCASSRRWPPSTTVRKLAMARKVAAALGGHVRGKTVAVPGRTFKPNTDERRAVDPADHRP